MAADDVLLKPYEYVRTQVLDGLAEVGRIALLIGETFRTMGRGLQAFDRDNVILNGNLGPLRDYEMNVELTYRAQIIPSWTVQPTAQWIFHPSQSLANILPPRTANVHVAFRTSSSGGVTVTMSMPASSSNCGELIAPAERITSSRAATV